MQGLVVDVQKASHNDIVIGVVNVVTHSQRRKTNYAMLHSGASVANQAFVVLDDREYHDTTMAMFSCQNLGPNSLYKKKIPYHIKI
jgi:hypothetical protein